MNLTGPCVLAAPQSKGTEPKHDPDYTGNACMTSCPAPALHLARAKGELGCIE